MTSADTSAMVRRSPRPVSSSRVRRSKWRSERIQVNSPRCWCMWPSSSMGVRTTRRRSSSRRSPWDSRYMAKRGARLRRAGSRSRCGIPPRRAKNRATNGFSVQSSSGRAQPVVAPQRPPLLVGQVLGRPAAQAAAGHLETGRGAGSISARMRRSPLPRGRWRVLGLASRALERGHQRPGGIALAPPDEAGPARRRLLEEVAEARPSCRTPAAASRPQAGSGAAGRQRRVGAASSR